ncbi:MAG: hypothetical protein WCP35_17990 [Verrucomicrobiota bacterium]
MQTITSPPRRLPVGIAGLVARCGANLVSCLAAGLTIGWMVLLGLGSCAFTARGDVPEVWRTSIKLDGVSYRAGQLCWKRDVSSLDFSRIQRSPSTGGTVRAPYYNASAATRVWSRTAELDDSLNVYWASGRWGQSLHGNICWRWRRHFLTSLWSPPCRIKRLTDRS